MPSPSLRRVVAIDDDPELAPILGSMLREHGFEVESMLECPTTIEPGRFNAILLDRNLGAYDGIAMIPRIKSMAPNVPIVLLTVEQSVQLVVEAIKAGAFDYITKPPSAERLLLAVHRACEMNRMAIELEGEDRNSIGFGRIIGRSNQMRAVFRVISNVAPTDVSVLICGATGTGKELVARTVHERSRRAKGPFVALNMAGVPNDLVESTLFGHERGAFSGADRRQIGACEEASGGTLFLDEITEMPMLLQAKLLRFLQERTIRRVGGSGEIATDVRILSATNRDPLEAVRAGRLREDLYYRLNLVPLVLPSLAEREGDIELLARSFLRPLAERHGRRFETIDEAAMRLLLAYRWPGNVRELQHVIECMVVTGSGPVIRPDMLPGAVKNAEVAPSSTMAPEVPAAPTGVRDLDAVEREAIQDALRQCGGRPADAARLLGISTATIYRRIKQHELARS